VVYSTDNGPHMNTWPDGAMTWFRSEKNTNWEGAFRVPCLVRWPGVIQPGTVTNELEPLCCIHGVSSKVLSMAFANLLLGADPSRERWVTTGASMVAKITAGLWQASYKVRKISTSAVASPNHNST